MIADILWYELKSHFPNVELGEFVVMPNHVHGVIIINEDHKPNVGATYALPNQNNDDNSNTNNNHSERARHALPLHTNSRFQNQGKRTLSAIVGSYKSAVSKHAHRLGFYFAWQRNYYEHIIRNEKSYRTITEYIMKNHTKWADDKFHVT